MSGTPTSPVPLALHSGEFLLCGLLRCPRCDRPHTPGVWMTGDRYYRCGCARVDARAAELAVCLRVMIYTATSAPAPLRRPAAQVAARWRAARPRDVRWLLRRVLTSVETGPDQRFRYRWRHRAGRGHGGD